jgi:hypothetical protein
MMVLLMVHVIFLRPAVVRLLVLVAIALILFPLRAFIPIVAMPTVFILEVAVFWLVKWAPVVSESVTLPVTVLIVHGPVFFVRAHLWIGFSPAVSCVLLIPRMVAVSVPVIVFAVPVISIVIILFVSHSFYGLMHLLGLRRQDEDVRDRYYSFVSA